MSIDDDIYEVMEHCKNSEVEKTFGRVCSYINRVEAEEEEFHTKYVTLRKAMLLLESPSEEFNAAFAKITELIAEMSWGVDLPSPMQVYFIDEDSLFDYKGHPDQLPPIKTKGLEVDPKNYEVVFEAIRRKLTGATEYDPYVTLQTKLNKAKDIITRAEDRINDMLQGDDGQAFDEAEAFLAILNDHLKGEIE